MTRDCEGIGHTDRTHRKLKCLGCKCEDHVYKNYPKKNKPVGCNLCGSAKDPRDECTEEPDPKKLFAKCKERKELYTRWLDAKVADFEAHAVVALLLLSKDDSPAPFDKYDPMFDALPDQREVPFVGESEGVRPEYIEAQAACSTIQRLERENTTVRFKYRKETGPRARTSWNDPQPAASTTPPSSGAEKPAPWRPTLKPPQNRVRKDIKEIRGEQVQKKHQQRHLQSGRVCVPAEARCGHWHTCSWQLAITTPWAAEHAGYPALTPLRNDGARQHPGVLPTHPFRYVGNLVAMKYTTTPLQDILLNFQHIYGMSL